MGLAASQARLLTITARKADCEFQSMNLSHQKIALARDMEKISQDYQEALNTTKLVYDYYGSGTSDMALNYDLLMSPSVYNDYYPKLVTDSKNRVMLNSAYAAAARAAGIPAEGLLGTASTTVRNKFIEALAGANIITPNTATSIEGVIYNNELGNGSTISAATTTIDVTYEQLLEMLQVNGYSTADSGISLGVNKDVLGIGSNERFNVVHSDGSRDTFEAGTSADLTIYDLLGNNNQYYISLLAQKGNELPLGEMYYLQQKLVGTDGAAEAATGDSQSILDWMYDQFATILGGTTGNDTALQYAYNAVYNLVYPSNGVADQYNAHLKDFTKDKGDREGIFEPENTDMLNAMKEVGEYINTKGLRSFYTSYENKSSQYLGMYFTGDKDQGFLHKDRKDKSQVSVNLNNIAKVFLTAFVDYMTGFEEGYKYEKGLVSSNVLYNGEMNKDFKFEIPVESDIDNNDNQLIANFYDTLFTRICLQGWVENNNIDDAEYLSEMFKNGMAYISSLSDDGYYYQSTYSTDRAILEVRDDDAIAKAEAKYNTEKAKLQNKEDTIDLKMKNLDTEISSLTTEYDTTKSVITKAIEKSFKRYDA